MMITLPTIGITFEADNVTVRDDGVVDDIEQHTINVYQDMTHKSVDDYHKEFDDSYLYKQLQNDPTAIIRGKYIEHKTSLKREFVYFYIKQNDINHIFTKSHEETHILHATGNIWRLKQLLNINYNFKEPSKCADEECEEIADLGGFYGLEHAKYDMATVKYPYRQNLLDLYKNKIR